MPRRKKLPPTVRRGEGGKMESVRTPIAPTQDSAPSRIETRGTISRPVKKRKVTRTGKALDKITGKILVPSVKRGKSGKIEAVSAEEKKAAVTTVLPAQEAMTQLREPSTRPATILKQQPAVKTKGFSTSYPKVEAAVNAAMHHLNIIKTGVPRSRSHNESLKAFDLIHDNIRSMSPEMHYNLGVARKAATPGSQSEDTFNKAMGAVSSRLAEGKRAHEENLARVQAGRLKAGQQVER